MDFTGEVIMAVVFMEVRKKNLEAVSQNELFLLFPSAFLKPT